MVLEALKSFLCCFHGSAEEGAQPDETTHLIPTENYDTPHIYTDVSFIDQSKIEERLTQIVRAKEGKMVNLASHIPFNLHQRTFHQDLSRGGSSRSRSLSVDRGYNPAYHRSSTHDFDGAGPSRLNQRQDVQYYGNDDYAGDGYGLRSSSSSRSRSPAVEQPQPQPILNLRLVGYVDRRMRGRKSERVIRNSDLGQGPVIGGSITSKQGSSSRSNSNDDGASISLATKYNLHLPDPASMIIDFD